MKTISYQKRGDIDVKQIIANFEELEERIVDVEDGVKGLDTYQGTFAISKLVDSATYFTMLYAKDHPNVEIESAYIQAADNLKEDVTIQILQDGKTDLVEPKTIKSTEKAGKGHSLDVLNWKVINRISTVEILSDSKRRVVVTMVFKLNE